jgi:hypothetical protein
MAIPGRFLDSASLCCSVESGALRVRGNHQPALVGVALTPERQSSSLRGVAIGGTRFKLVGDVRGVNINGDTRNALVVAR